MSAALLARKSKLTGCGLRLEHAGERVSTRASPRLIQKFHAAFFIGGCSLLDAVVLYKERRRFLFGWSPLGCASFSRLLPCGSD